MDLDTNRREPVRQIELGDQEQWQGITTAGKVFCLTGIEYYLWMDRTGNRKATKIPKGQFVGSKLISMAGSGKIFCAKAHLSQNELIDLETRNVLQLVEGESLDREHIKGNDSDTLVVKFSKGVITYLNIITGERQNLKLPVNSYLPIYLLEKT